MARTTREYLETRTRDRFPASKSRKGEKPAQNNHGPEKGLDRKLPKRDATKGKNRHARGRRNNENGPGPW